MTKESQIGNYIPFLGQDCEFIEQQKPSEEAKPTITEEIVKNPNCEVAGGCNGYYTMCDVCYEDFKNWKETNLKTK